jgi:RNA polymerase sigma-70 factor (ECF subfamily)
VRRPSALPMGEEVDLIADLSGNRPEAWIESNELYVAIAALPDDFRDTLIAIDIVGLSYREAARALHAREETITTRLHRARQRVATALRGPSGPSAPPRGPSAPGGELQQHGGRDAGA